MSALTPDLAELERLLAKDSIILSYANVALLRNALAALLAERERLREALRIALDCRGPFRGQVSKLGGDPALCPKCEAIARAALEAKS